MQTSAVDLMVDMFVRHGAEYIFDCCRLIATYFTLGHSVHVDGLLSLVLLEVE